MSCTTPQAGGFLDTDRLVMRRLVPGDAEALHRVTGDPAVMRYWHPGPDTDEVATAARIREIDAHWREHGFGDYAVIERETGELVGLAGVHYVPGIVDVNMGYALMPSRWRRGYGSELCAALLDFGFEVLHLPELVAVIDPRNSASIALAERMNLNLRREFLWRGQSRLAYVVARREREAATRVSLRPVRPDDLPAIDRWARVAGGQMSRTRPHDPAADRHDPAGGLFWWVITRDGADAGTVWVELTADGREGVLGIFLDPDLYGRGIGTAAVKAAAAAFRRAHPGTPVCLHVRKTNARAIACYRRAGFVVVEEGTKQSPSGELIAFHRMVLRGEVDIRVDGPALDLAVRIAGPDERMDVDAFLRAEAYGGGTRPSDDLVIALEEGRVAGAFRLAREHGVLVLRGMRVRHDVRRRGIGRRLLEALTDLVEPCYCVPHAYLEEFYRGAGFARLPDAEAPGFLRERLARYREQGLDVVVMRREPADPMFAGECDGGPA